MAENKMGLAQIIAKSPVAWGLGLVKDFMTKNPGLMQNEQAQRCAMSAMSKVVGFMGEQGLKWEEIDINHLSRILIRLAITGLDADSGDWYAYSRKDTKTGLQKFDPNPSYNGERKLRVMYSIGSFGKIKDIVALTVREGDKLTIVRDLFGKVASVDYQPLPFNQGKIKGYLGITLFEDGTTVVKEYTPDKIEEYHKANPNKSPAWDKWPEEMAHAKVVKHTAKDYQYNLPTQMKNALDDIDVADAKEEAEQNEATIAIDITPPAEEQKQADVKPAEIQAEQQIALEYPDVLK